MTCREFVDFIGGYLSGELTPDVATQFERHLSRCSNCTVYLASYRKTIELGRHALADPEAELPVDVPEELIDAILATATPRRRRPPHRASVRGGGPGRAPRGPRSRRSHS